jgi:hypothetical protein
MNIDARARGAAPILALAFAGCATLQYRRMEPPQGSRVLGLEFGLEREAVEGALRGAGLSAHAAPDDSDALVADRCPAAPAPAPCRLVFGPKGLYAARIEVPAGEAGALVSAVEKGLGAARRDAAAAPVASGLLAAWDRPGWTVAVSRVGGAVAPVAALIVERDAAAPPVVAGVPLGRRRAAVEALVARDGGQLTLRDEETTGYAGCPQGSPDALSCVILFQAGRAASVTEVLPAPTGDRAALEAWRLRAERMEREIGRPPVTSCPDNGPDRIAGDCAATWSSDRLVVVVGAHRNAGGKHRGTISVYTAWTYPPLTPDASGRSGAAAP